MGNSGGKSNAAAAHASPETAALAAQPRFPCRKCGKKVLQTVLHMHELQCAGNTGHTSKKSSKHNLATPLAIDGDADESKRAVTAAGSSSRHGLESPAKVNCPYCHKPLLASVFHLHIAPCQERHDHNVALQLHRSLNMSDAEREEQKAAAAAQAAAAQAEHDAAVAAELSLGGLEPGPIGTNGRIDRVDEASGEFARVRDAFAATVRRKKVVAVWKVTNERLKARYELLRTQIAEVNAAHGKTVRDANEALMFHGTSFRAIPLICELGFNRSFCGQHGTALGKGVYFAQQASYSANPTYSPAHEGVSHLLYCRVAVGEYTKGASRMVTPPPREEGGVLPFDSVADRAATVGGGKPSVVVVFQDAQAVPEYIVSFKSS
mmetsp:Transcript_73878/g.149399  ORF Transcript_73878/g.149399 Transcript_73878/m.149399 type:complete len:378 (-) Transcript_73878:62-1195(-)